ncbi:MAG: peptidoglycan-binding protein [Clostridia bacterium]|nr:peptidoglycan-binding protein [Clostridia bacterium]
MSLTPTPLPPVPDTVREKAATDMVTPEPALHNGSQGEKVWKLQERLQVLGYYTDAVDGQFGQGTRDAVIAFQKKNGLEADGYAGEETQKVLYSEDAVPNSQ